MPDTFPSRLAALRAKGLAALVRHARRPQAFGAADEHQRLWFAANEARYALAEGNPVFASGLLPATGAALPVGEGVPLLPAGVRWVVDETLPNTLTLTVDIAAGNNVTARVTPPAGTPFTAPLTSDATRLATRFAAGADGVYTVAFQSSGSPLTTILVPVSRSLFRQLREDSRALGYAFARSRPPQASPDYRLRLALLIGAESAAQTGQHGLADQLLGRARQVPAAPTPTALYPFRRG